MDRAEPTESVDFERFLATAGPRLRTALTAAYGPVNGRAAAVDALSWAWEHWSRLRDMSNPVGYLFRVGQTSARRQHATAFPLDVDIQAAAEVRPWLDLDLVRSLGDLSEQQRLVVLLVHGFGWTVRETAEALQLAPSTVQTHAERAIARLRQSLEGCDAHDR